MYLLVKDHKGMDSEGLTPTRPVVSACSSMGVHLTNILSTILEPLATRLGKNYEFISTEDMLAKIDKFNGDLEGIRDYYANKLGRGVGVEEVGDLLVILAVDCVAMFPSMDATNTGKIVAKMFLESDLKVGEKWVIEESYW